MIRYDFMKQFSLVTILLFISLFGCMTVDENELYGRYLLEFPFGSEELILYDNGTYKQIITIKDEEDIIFENTNTWKYDKEYNDIALSHGLILVNVLCELRDDYKIPSKGYLLRGVIKYTPFGDISLSTACESVTYTKVE